MEYPGRRCRFLSMLVNVQHFRCWTWMAGSSRMRPPHAFRRAPKLDVFDSGRIRHADFDCLCAQFPDRTQSGLAPPGRISKPLDKSRGHRGFYLRSHLRRMRANCCSKAGRRILGLFHLIQICVAFTWETS
jgi:hypothetical protein